MTPEDTMPTPAGGDTHPDDRPGAPSPLGALFPGLGACPQRPVVGASQGDRVRVERRRCVARGEDTQPVHSREAYEATVVRVSAGGMVYLDRGDGQIGVVHGDEVKRLGT